VDHVIAVDDKDLRKLMKEYFHYFINQQTHLGLDKDAPESRSIPKVGKIDENATANGLHNYYFRTDA
jgi:hypothetical protein